MRKLLALVMITLIMACAGVNPAPDKPVVPPAEKKAEVVYPQMTLPSEVMAQFANTEDYKLLGSVVDDWGNMLMFVTDNTSKCVAIVLLTDGRMAQLTCEEGYVLYQDVCLVQDQCTKNPYDQPAGNSI